MLPSRKSSVSGRRHGAQLAQAISGWGLGSRRLWYLGRWAVTDAGSSRGWFKRIAWGSFRHSTVKIRAYVNAKFDILYSHSGCIRLLARLGSSITNQRRCPTLLMSESRQHSSHFIKIYWVICLQTRRFISRMPFIQNIESKPSHGWAHKGTNSAIQTTSGRVNIHDALNLETLGTSRA